MTLGQLCAFAAERGIEIDDFPMRKLRALALPDGCIGMDRRKFADDTEYKCILAHEIGHCETGTFYSLDCSHSVREHCERQADLWAVEALVPPSRLRDAIDRGMLHPRALARHFDVTEKFIRAAMDLYDKF